MYLNIFGPFLVENIYKYLRQISVNIRLNILNILLKPMFLAPAQVRQAHSACVPLCLFFFLLLARQICWPFLANRITSLTFFVVTHSSFPNQFFCSKLSSFVSGCNLNYKLHQVLFLDQYYIATLKIAVRIAFLLLIFWNSKIQESSKATATGCGPRTRTRELDKKKPESRFQINCKKII